MADITKDIEAFNNMRVKIESQYLGKWILIHDEKFISAFDSFEKAAEDAVKQFGAGPYLIRQAGAPQIPIPASVAFYLTKHA
jgi:hypothetical protein